MRNAARVLNDYYEEVSVSSLEVLEANVIAIRADLNEHKAEFRAAVAKIDNDIKNAVTKLEAEIRATADRARQDLQLLADRMESQFALLRAEIADQRGDHKSLSAKVDNHFQIMLTEHKEMRSAITELTKVVIKI